MASSYPGAVDSFPTFVDYVNYVLAADVNNADESIVAIETTIGAGSGTSATNPLYSVAYGVTYGTVTARLAASENYVKNLNAGSPSGYIPVAEFGIANPIDGVYSNQKLLIQGGTPGVSLTGGNGTIIFPTQFPNGLVSITASLPLTSPNDVSTVNLFSPSTADFGVHVVVNGSAPTATYFVSWIALGF